MFRELLKRLNIIQLNIKSTLFQSGVKSMIMTKKIKIQVFINFINLILCINRKIYNIK